MRRSCCAPVPYVELWELDPLAHLKKGRAILCFGPMLHVLLIGVLTAQAILLANSSSLFGRQMHENWVDWLLPAGFSQFGGSPLSFPDDEFFIYENSLVLETIDSAISSYFTQLSGNASDVLDYVETSVSASHDGALASLASPTITFTSQLDYWANNTPASCTPVRALSSFSRDGARPFTRRWYAETRRRGIVNRHVPPGDVTRSQRTQRSKPLTQPITSAPNKTPFCAQSHGKLPRSGKTPREEAGFSYRGNAALRARSALQQGAGDASGRRVCTTISSLAEFDDWLSLFAPTPAAWAQLLQVCPRV